MGAIPMGYETF